MYCRKASCMLHSIDYNVVQVQQYLHNLHLALSPSL